ncbi:MAG: SpoIIAA family protein, partial [Planctomycetota bacterium]
MIEIVEGLPLGVLGFRAHGKVTAADYRDVLAPAVEGALVNEPHLRLLYDIGPDFEGFEVGAMWEDAKIGLRQLTSWRRIAVVCDMSWLKLTMRGFGWMVPCPFRIYPREKMAEAMDWIADPGTSGLVATLDP